MNFKDQQFKFHDFPGLGNEILKFHDFPGFPWPVRTLIDFNFQILVLGQLFSEFCWGVTFRWNCYVNEHAPSILLVLVNAQGFAQNRWNRHLHISPNTLACLPPKFCISIVFWFHSGPLQYPKEIKDNRYAKFWGQTRCIMGDVQMANEQF